MGMSNTYNHVSFELMNLSKFLNFFFFFFLVENMSSIRRPKYAENPSENIKVFENISIKLNGCDFNSVHIRCKISA